MENTYIELAEWIMFAQNKTNDALKSELDKYNLEFRKHKGIKDINDAIQKARDPKNGHYRTELEVEMLAVYLDKTILKKKKCS
jgi:hypothetical protein